MIRQEWIQIRERIKERSHEMKQERCRANYVGVCFRGDACPYSHDPLIPIKKRSQERKQVRRKVKRPERCRANYVGACIRGDACPYSHELLMPMRGKSSKQNAKDGLCLTVEASAKEYESVNALVDHQVSTHTHKGRSNKYIVCRKAKCGRYFKDSNEFDNHKPTCGKKLKKA